MLSRTLTALAGAGLTAALTLGTPAVASASSGEPDSPAAGCPAAQHRQAVVDLLLTHPQLAGVLQELRGLPADERADAWHAFLAGEPDVAAAVEELRAESGDRRPWTAPRSGVVQRLVDALARHPELAGVLQQLRDTPPGERRDVVQDHVDQHPEVRAELRDLARVVHRHAHLCGSAR